MSNCHLCKEILPKHRSGMFCIGCEGKLLAALIVEDSVQADIFFDHFETGS